MNPALIPLYARAGPNLEVHTSATDTAQWLKDRLVGGVWMDEEDLERFQAIQCPVGVLVAVDGPSTSELLIYGVLSVGGDDHDGENRQLRIYASPLSGSMITRAQELSAPKPAECAEFLPDLRSPSPKRKRVASLFDSVALHHQRVRQMVPQAQVKRESQEPSLLRSRPGSRAPSRPATATGHGAGHGRTKSVPLAETEAALKQEPSDADADGKPPDAAPDAASTVAENKNTISRTVVTCMRLYGFNRVSSSSSKASSKPDQTVTQADSEEFKAMYHATYRASTFALRKYVRDRPPVLEKQKAMGYIDEFLRLFCNDLYNELR